MLPPLPPLRQQHESRVSRRQFRADSLSFAPAIRSFALSLSPLENPESESEATTCDRSLFSSPLEAREATAACHQDTRAFQSTQTSPNYGYHCHYSHDYGVKLHSLRTPVSLASPARRDVCLSTNESQKGDLRASWRHRTRGDAHVSSWCRGSTVARHPRVRQQERRSKRHEKQESEGRQTPVLWRWSIRYSDCC